MFLVFAEIDKLDITKVKFLKLNKGVGLLRNIEGKIDCGAFGYCQLFK